MRKAMLREKKRTIEEELGEAEEGELSSDEFTEYKAKIKKAGMPKEVLEKAEKELKRMASDKPQTSKK
jgi:ATP-dependent Lon protease